MSDYERLREDVAALVAVPGAVTRAKVFAVLAAHPPLPPAPAEDVFADAVFNPSVFG